MRRNMRWWLLPIVAGILYLAFPRESNAGFIQTQRAQRYITITINVTPGPYGYRVPLQAGGREIALAHRFGRGASGDEGAIPQVHAASPRLIAQASVQHAVPVEANVTPDPTATLFQGTPNNATINVTAGQSATVACAYQIIVTTAITVWTVDVGLSNNFSTAFNGTNLAHNSYLSTPRPTSTPFSVYPDNNNAWSIMDKNGGNKTYCVDLTVNVPITVLGGVYTTTAVYTLYY